MLSDGDVLSSFAFKLLGDSSQVSYTIEADAVMLLLPKDHGLDRFVEEYAANDVFCKFEFISKVVLFRNLSFEYLFLLARSAHYKRYKYGDTILSKVQKPSSIFIVKQGSLIVVSVLLSKRITRIIHRSSD